jgi:hypothetical protein
MHRYLYNYEDFLLIDDDYVARAGSKVIGGPGSRPRRGYSDNGEDDDYDSYEDDYSDEYDFDEDDDYGDYEGRFERRFQ